MAIRNDFTAGEVLAAADLNDTFGAKANLASPTFTGTPAAPTAASGTNTTQVATTAFARTAGGLVHIATESFSAVSSVSLNNVFTSTYDTYRVVIRTNNAGNAELRSRLRLAGSDATASSYNSQRLSTDTTSVYAQGGTVDFMHVTALSASADTFGVMDLNSPAIATPTMVLTNSNNIGPYNHFIGLRHNVSTAYDGITFYPTTSTITGTVRVYGYLNS